jgi:hypothetical protein
MSVYFEYPTELAAAGKGALTATAFAQAENNILAAATKNGDITLFLEEVKSATATFATRKSQRLRPLYRTLDSCSASLFCAALCCIVLLRASVLSLM